MALSAPAPLSTAAPDQRVGQPSGLAWDTGKRRGALQYVALVVAFAVLALAHWGPALPGLKPAPQTVLGVFCWFIIVLAANALPQIIVGVLAPLFLVVLNGAKVSVAYNAFSNDIFFLILGAFVLVAVMMGTGLAKRVSFAIVSRAGSTTATRILASLMAAGTALHVVLPTVSETALFLPISRCLGEMSEGAEPPPGLKRANQAMILTVTGLVPVFAGVFFLTAGVPNLVLVALLKGSAKVNVNWLQWLLYNLPLWGLIPIVYLLVRWWFQLGKVELPNAASTLPRVRAELGPIKRVEIWTVVCIAIALLLWVTEPLHHISPGMVALIMVGLLFLPGLGMRFAPFADKVMWEMLFLISGAISLGNVLFSSGAVTWLAKYLVGPVKNSGITSPLLILFVLAFALHVARAGIISAGAMAAAFVPLIIAIAPQLGFNVLPFALILTNALNFAVFVPISAVAILIAVQAADLKWREMVIFGSIVSVVANVYLIVVQSAWMSLLGFPLRG